MKAKKSCFIAETDMGGPVLAMQSWKGIKGIREGLKRRSFEVCRHGVRQ